MGFWQNAAKCWELFPFHEILPKFCPKNISSIYISSLEALRHQQIGFTVMNKLKPKMCKRVREPWECLGKGSPGQCFTLTLFCKGSWEACYNRNKCKGILKKCKIWLNKCLNKKMLSKILHEFSLSQQYFVEFLHYKIGCYACLLLR